MYTKEQLEHMVRYTKLSLEDLKGQIIEEHPAIVLLQKKISNCRRKITTRKTRIKENQAALDYGIDQERANWQKVQIAKDQEDIPALVQEIENTETEIEVVMEKLYNDLFPAE